MLKNRAILVILNFVLSVGWNLPLAASIATWQLEKADKFFLQSKGLEKSPCRRKDLPEFSIYENIKFDSQTNTIIIDASNTLIKNNLRLSPEFLNSFVANQSSETIDLPPEVHAKFDGACIKTLTIEGLSWADASFQGASFLCDDNKYGCHFIKSSLRSANFNGSFLSDVTFKDTFIDLSNFSETHLNGLLFRDSQIINTDFTKANLSNILIENTLLNTCDFSQAHLSKLCSKKSRFANVKFEKAKLNEIDFFGSPITSSSSFENASLDVVKFQSTPYEPVENLLENINFNNAQLVAVEFEGNMPHATFQGAELLGVSFTGDLNHGNFTHAKTQGVYEPGMKRWTKGVSFQRTNLANALFVSAQLPGAQFIEANLANSDLSRGDFSHGDFMDANLNGATLFHTDLSHANLIGCVLQKVDLSTAHLTKALLLTSALEPHQKRYHDPLVFVGADLRPLDNALKGRDLSFMDFTGSNLNGMDLNETNFQGANLSNTNFIGANLTGALLVDADLTGAKLLWATLTNTNFAHAQLKNAWVLEKKRGDIEKHCSGCLNESKLFTNDFRNLDFSHLKLSHLDLHGLDFSGSNFSNSLFEVVHVYKANLSDCRFENAHIDHSLFMETDLKRAHMGGAEVKDSNFQMALLEDVQMQNAKLVEVNLEGADLTNADLSGSFLSHIQFARNKLKELNLTSATLKSLIMGPWVDFSEASKENLQFEIDRLIYKIVDSQGKLLYRSEWTKQAEEYKEGMRMSYRSLHQLTTPCDKRQVLKNSDFDSFSFIIE